LAEEIAAKRTKAFPTTCKYVINVILMLHRYYTNTNSRRRQEMCFSGFLDDVQIP
jgi:hypothetical protein